MLKDWINEARPKTLLLGASNCALGCGLGFYYGAVNLYNITVAICIIITGVLLQILSNFANDYGDAIKGADRKARLGPMRALMTGDITLLSLKRAMALVIFAIAFFGAIATYMSLSSDINALAWFLFLGVVSIIAALFYTVGVSYGYKGLGDIAVFLFFGVLAIVGPQLMISNASGGGIELYPDTPLLAIAVGCASVMVLQVANMRDISEDLITGKKTIASRLGYKGSCFYLSGLLSITTISSVLACVLSHKTWEASILLVSLVPLLITVIRIFKHGDDESKIATELKFASFGCAIHNIAWMIVLIIDFWVYL